MKRIAFILVVLFASAAAQEEPARVYFYRGHGLAGSMHDVPILVDGKPLCKLAISSFCTTKLTPGKHAFMAKGTREWGRGKPPEFKFESGRSYYFEVESVKAVFWNPRYLINNGPQWKFTPRKNAIEVMPGMEEVAEAAERDGQP